MNTQQLLCFVCVADRLNFTKAAEELFLSPPTVTHHIQTLEAELKMPLFVRNSKMVRLTDAGKGFYNDAREILAKIEIAQKKMHNAAVNQVRLFHIGCTSTSELRWLREPLQKIHQERPGFSPVVHVKDYFTMKQMFEAEQLDAMLCTRSMTRKLSNCEFHSLGRAALYAILPADSPLAGQETLHFADLKDQPVLTLHPKLVPFEQSDRLRDWIIEHSLNHLDIHCENDRAGILLAQCGYGVAIFPEFYAVDLPQDLVRRPFEPGGELLPFGVACRKQGKDDATRRFLAALPPQQD